MSARAAAALPLVALALAARAGSRAAKPSAAQRRAAKRQARRAAPRAKERARQRRRPAPTSSAASRRPTTATATRRRRRRRPRDATAGGKKVKTKTYTFGAMDVEGKLKTPQLLYFLNRVKLELDMSAPDKRSFMKELGKAPMTRTSELSRCDLWHQPTPRPLPPPPARPGSRRPRRPAVRA